MPRQSIPRILGFSFFLALISGIIVSTTTVLLAPRQQANLEQEQHQNLRAMVEQQPGLRGMLDKLDAAGALQGRVVDLETGQFAPDIAPSDLNQTVAMDDPASIVAIPKSQDIAGIKYRPRYATVYMIRDKTRIHMIILPIYGKGYGSTLRGFLALAGDTNTIVALSFHEHGETPGLGARIDDPQWLVQWQGKQIHDANGNLRIRLSQQKADSSSSESVFQVDGLSGATYTSRGVEKLIHYWLGEHGFGPFLRRLGN